MISSPSFVSITRQRPVTASYVPRDSTKALARKTEATIALIAARYAAGVEPWVIGFSGGKDSTAVLALTYLALLRHPAPRRPVKVLYCDTGVDIPLIRQYVLRTLSAIKGQAKRDGIPLQVTLARPRLTDRFFVKVLGRGYPPPTNKFRWCTDRLRIRPIERILAESGVARPTVLLGVRRGESTERDRTITRHSVGDPYTLIQHGRTHTTLFAPVIDYSTQDIWAVVHEYSPFAQMDTALLTKLYKEASGECPIIKDPRGSPCGQGRFGCWTCTVVRKDKAVTGLVESGHESLAPLLRWRNRLAEVRDIPVFRCKV